MVDKNGKDIKTGQIIFATSLRFKKGRYYYIEKCSRQSDVLYVKRVNKDFSFNRYDKEHNSLHPILFPSLNSVEIVEPLPDKFRESLRTLHFYIDELLEEFGTLFVRTYTGVIFRAVRYENGSYGIIQNRLTHDGSCIDHTYQTDKLFIDLTYDELATKWNKIKNRPNVKWLEDF